MNDEINKEPPRQKGGWLAGGSVLTGFLAFVGASCCVLPIVLVNLGVSTALVGNLAFFAKAQIWFQWITIGLIAAGFFFAFRRGRPSRRVLFLLITATMIAIAAYILPSYEGDMLRWLNLR